MSIQKNIAVVGCGYWGKNLVRNMHEIGALAAVSDSNAEHAETFAAEYDVHALSFHGVLERDDIEGVVLAVPAPLHASMAIAAFKAGKHVFVEKPIALSQEDAIDMIEAAQNANRHLMVGHLLHYHSAFLKLKQMVQDGVFGTLRHITSNRLSFGKIRTEENVLWSFSPHDISMILGLADQTPTQVAAAYIASLPESPLASTATVHMAFEDGLSAQVNASWLNPFKEQKLVVVGSEAMAVFDDTLGWDQKLALYKHKVRFENNHPILEKADLEYVAVEPSEPLKDECLHFVHCIATGETPRTDGEEGLRVLRVLQACDNGMEIDTTQEQAA